MRKNIFISEANAHGNNKGVWYFLGCLISFGLGQILGAIPMFFILILNGDINTLSRADMLNPDTYGIDKNLFLITVFLPFLFGIILLWLYVKFAHQKPFKLLITPFKKIKWNYFFGATLLWGLFLMISELIFYAQYPEHYSLEFNGSKFIVLLLVSLTFLFIQTSFEEILFRGYIMQWMGKYFNSAWIPLIITSVSFGLVHGANPEMLEYGPSVMIIYIAMGFALGYITLMSRSLEMALGMHFINNFFASVVVNYENSALLTDSLFKVRDMDLGMNHYIVTILTLILFIVIMKFIFKLDFNIDKEKKSYEKAID